MLDLKIDTEITEERVLLTVSGELDIASAPVLSEALDLAEESRPGHLVIDLADLTFMDSTGISVLVGARTRVCERGGVFHVVNVVGGPRKALELTGLYDLVVVDPLRADAEAERPSA
jgi:anti-sigma B factor antagonist